MDGCLRLHRGCGGKAIRHSLKHQAATIISVLAWAAGWFSVKFVRQGLKLVGQASEAV
jgi:hypothetical protein